MRRISKLSVTAAGVFAVALGIASPAYADYGPSSTDIVGVGSDTVQNIANFVADGDQNGHFGYNASDNPDKWVSFDATPDANDRAGYLNGSTLGSLKPLTPTIVLREGTSPVQRPNGSSAGITALLADTGSTEQINYVRASREPKASEQATALSNGWGYLHVVQVSTDPLEMAVASSGTNMPAAGLSAQELVSIYTCAITKWNQLPGNSGGSGDTIIALYPQSSSGTYSTFFGDLTNANGGTPVAPSSLCTSSVEENDPTAVTSASVPADAIEPMSLSRLKLWASGYFKDPTKTFGQPVVTLSPGINEVHGCPGTPTDLDCEAASPTRANAGDSNPIYNDVRGLYYIFRNSDAAGAPLGFNGTTHNWVQVLLSDPAGSTVTPWLNKTGTKALIASAGATPNYQDLGNVHSG
jgi:ABC-type phosphate transport system substrate-binding protein